MTTATSAGSGRSAWDPTLSSTPVPSAEQRPRALRNATCLCAHIRWKCARAFRKTDPGSLVQLAVFFVDGPMFDGDCVSGLAGTSQQSSQLGRPALCVALPAIRPINSQEVDEPAAHQQVRPEAVLVIWRRVRGSRSHSSTNPIFITGYRTPRSSGMSKSSHQIVR